MLHDLHESVAYLYDNTVGDGPYNAWLDPILTDEWQMIGWNNVSEMTKFGMPGVFTHGTFDTWTPGYLMFIAATHNGISRLYETFGNGGADTLERTLGPADTARTWYKQNPPLPKARWSQRNNNNYQETGLLVSLNHFADNKNLFLKNFYLKSKRSILKPKTRRTRRLRVPRRRSAARAAGRPAARAAAPGLRDLARDSALHRHHPGRRRRGRPDVRPRLAATPTADGAARRRRTVPPRSAPATGRPSRRTRTFPAGSLHPADGSARTAASPTPCSTTSTGRPTIRSATPTTTPGGRSASCSTCGSCG